MQIWPIDGALRPDESGPHQVVTKQTSIGVAGVPLATTAAMARKTSKRVDGGHIDMDDNNITITDGHHHTAEFASKDAQKLKDAVNEIVNARSSSEWFDPQEAEQWRRRTLSMTKGRDL